MGCAPSSATGSSSRVSHADDAVVGVRRQSAALIVTSSPVADGESLFKTRENGGMKGSPCNDVFLGLTSVRQSPMSMLLLFPRVDSQVESLERAAQAVHFDVGVARTPEAALQLYLSKRHSVIFVDTRPAAGIDAEAFSRLLRSTQNSESTVLIAVRPAAGLKGKEESSMLPLLKAGFNRQFVENNSVGVCLAELQSIEHNDCRLQSKLKAAHALLAAVDNSNDAIEITDENHQIQYVNAAYERLFGYKGDEIVGKNCRDLTVSDCNTRADLIDTINAQLRTGSTWDGAYHMRKKTGENLWQKCHMIPVVGHSGKIRHFVAIRNQSHFDRRSSSDMSNGITAAHGPSLRQRKESLSRIASMTNEAPITKVINMIGMIREDSPPNVVQTLDNILEVLRSSELYAPHLTQQVREDRVVNDLVGGLMTMDDEVRHFRKVSMVKRGSCSSEVPFLSRTHSQLSQATDEVQRLLETEADWGFNIIELELLTKKSPLVHLAMKTLQRFEVLDFLRIDEAMMYSWLQLIESNYHADNPYHNSTHAADVMHATAFFLGCDKLKGIFTEMDEAASLLAAIVHDLDHPGKTNSYLVNSGSQLALLYNDLAVLESHHVSLAYRLSTRDDKVNIFKNLERDDYRSLRQQMVDMVLATEMTRHFEHLNRFISVISQSPQTDDEDLSSLHSPGSSSSGTERRMSVSARLSMPENKTLIKRMLIKCADVSNPARPLNLCMEWAIRIAKEYCQQTDDEKARGLPVVMPVFDRSACNVPKSQMSFIDFFINDMFDAWNTFCVMPEMVRNIKSNYAYWKQQEPIEAKKIAEQQAKNASS